ncbi:MAG: hypothetical protein QXU98_11490 [Candidatus Parvarchaeota archaeon]
MKLTASSIDKDTLKIFEIVVWLTFATVLIGLIINLSQPISCPDFEFKNGTFIPAYTINFSHLSWTYPVVFTKLTPAQSQNITELIC